MVRFVIFLLMLLTFACKSKIKQKAVKAETFKNYNYRISLNLWNGFYGFSEEYLLDNLNGNTLSSKSFDLQYITYKQQQDKNNKRLKVFVPFDTIKIDIPKQKCDTLFELSKAFFRTFEFNNYDTFGKFVPIVTDDDKAKVELSYGGRTLVARISSVNNPTISTPQFDSLLSYFKKCVKVAKKK